VDSNQLIKAVILVGGRDFGRCPLASKLPAALWPVLARPALERLLTSLADQGVKQAVVCCNGNYSLVAESVEADNRLTVKYVEEPLPAGTAGCIRRAAGNQEDALYVVLPAGLVSCPDVGEMIKVHQEGGSELTVMLNPEQIADPAAEPADIYVCNAGILKYIPRAGYFDIKEGLIPEMLRAGKSVHAAVMPNRAGNFRNHQEYLLAVANYLRNGPKVHASLRPSPDSESEDVWISENARVDCESRIYGPAVIMDGASVSKGALILGPAVLGNNVSVGADSIVSSSVLWDGAKAGPGCKIRRCVLDRHTSLPADSAVEGQAIPCNYGGVLKSFAEDVGKTARTGAVKLQTELQPLLRTVNKYVPEPIRTRRTGFVYAVAAGAVLVALLWCYKAAFADLWSLWHRSDEYSSGLLVPFLAVYVLWSRRDEIAQCRIAPALWGVFAFAAAQLVRVFGLYFMYGSAERISIILTVAALVLLLFGAEIFRKVFTVLIFLCLMLPWPNRIQAAVTLPLQRWATSSAVFCLEMVGYDVIREGNVIHIGDVSVAVAEACNGLRMITAFFVISALVVLLVKRAWWEKLIVLISSLPIALFCNTIRLTITAVFFTMLDAEHWEQVFHDFGGYAMMPLALAAVVAELWLLKKLTTVPQTQEAVIITRHTN
jgi:exosortase